MIFFRDESPEERAATAQRVAVEGAHDPLVRMLARSCWSQASRRADARAGYPVGVAFLDAAQEATQRCGYVPDPPGFDVLRTPAETIAGGGDCEDLSSLFVALVVAGHARWALPLGACVVWVRQPGAPQDHVSAWAWREATRGAGELLASVMDRGAPLPAGAEWVETSIAARRGEDPWRALERIGGQHDRIEGRRA